MRLITLLAGLLGLQKRHMQSLSNIKIYRKDVKKFKESGGVINSYYPILTDFHDVAGSTNSQYFIHDLLVASKVFRSNPKEHFDVASRVDGLVAHIASFREVTVLDVRPLVIKSFPQIKYIQADLMSTDFDLRSVCDSLSCLSALEHFGLGRYNDPVDPNGHLLGLKNLIHMLKPGGVLYLSFPVCSGPTTVHFNAHRVFNYKDILQWLAEFDNVTIENFDYVDDDGVLYENMDINSLIPQDLLFGCAIYTLRKSMI